MVTQIPFRRFRSIAMATALMTAATPTLSALGQQAYAQAPVPTAPQASAAPQGPSLPLTMDQAVTMGLESNLGLKAERLNVDIAAQNIAISRSVFLPVTGYSLSRNNAQAQPVRLPDGTQSVSSSNNVSGGAFVQQNLPWFGGQYTANWSSNRATSTGNQTYNPSLGSTLRVDFVQPIWRDYSIDQQRASVERDERRRAIADITLQERIVATEANIRFAYLSLVSAIEGRKVAQQNMDIAQQTLKNASERVRVGQSPEIEIVQARSEVARNEEQLLVADARIGTTEDDLRALILEHERQDYWTVKLEPIDQINVKPPTIDVDAAIKTAQANRLDLAVQRRNMELTDLSIRLNSNDAHPTVDLNVNYIAAATGGTATNIDALTRGYGTVLGDSFGGAYPNWTVGVRVGYPLGRSAAEASLAQSQIQKSQQQISIRDLELAIAFDVREAARQVQNTYQRVLASRVALEAFDEQYRAEEKRFAVGIGSTLDLQVRQRDLAQARIGALNAEIAYASALITFDRVQKIR
jgi:outer membrane protein